MDCFVCAQHGTESRAIAICQNCQVGLCITHLAEQQSYRPGGVEIAGCPHELPVTNPAPRG
jgi:hypothetical protein